MKERANQNSEEITRSIFASVVATMGLHLLSNWRKPKQLNEQLESIKMFLKLQIIQQNAYKIRILERYKITSMSNSENEGESFSLFDFCLAHLKRFQFSQHLRCGMQMEL